MKLAPVIFGLMIFVLLFGCFGPTPTPSDNGTTTVTKNDTTTQNGTVTVIIGPQKNQTATNTGGQENTSNDGEPTQPPKNTSIEYGYDPNQKLGVYFIAAEDGSTHGASVLIKKGDLDILVDGGSAQSGGKVVDFLKSKGVDDIDVLVSTNADPGRYGGIATVADNFKIEHFWWSGNDNNDPEYKKLIELMAGETKLVQTVQEGYSEDLNGINASVLNPQKKVFNDRNNDAVVLKIVDRKFSMLLTSDIIVGAQGVLINTQNLTADIMDAPYYGTGTGTNMIGLFLQKTAPKAVIITGSSDDSAVNGGSRSPFEILMGVYKIGWYATYVNGSIRIESDGTSYAIQKN